MGRASLRFFFFLFLYPSLRRMGGKYPGGGFSMMEIEGSMYSSQEYTHNSLKACSLEENGGVGIFIDYGCSK